jgi:hypothetical protein
MGVGGHTGRERKGYAMSDRDWYTRWDSASSVHRVYSALAETGMAGVVDKRRVPGRGNQHRDRWFARPTLYSPELPEQFTTKEAAAEALVAPLRATTRRKRGGQRSPKSVPKDR